MLVPKLRIGMEELGKTARILASRCLQIPAHFGDGNRKPAARVSHERHPKDVEECDHDANRIAAHPIEPADAVFALLLARQAIGVRQKLAPVLAKQLEAAERPA